MPAALPAVSKQTEIMFQRLSASFPHFGLLKKFLLYYMMLGSKGLLAPISYNGTNSRKIAEERGKKKERRDRRWKIRRNGCMMLLIS